MVLVSKVEGWLPNTYAINAEVEGTFTPSPLGTLMHVDVRHCKYNKIIINIDTIT